MMEMPWGGNSPWAPSEWSDDRGSHRRGRRAPGQPRHRAAHLAPHHGHARKARVLALAATEVVHHGHEPAVYRAHATLKAFDPATNTATIQLTRSPDTTIAGVPVSRAIGAATLVAGATLAVIFFDHHNSADAMVVGVY